MAEELKGRAAFLAWKNKTYPLWLKDKADKWDALPENIRAAVCRYARVDNERLDELDCQDRRELLYACHRLLAALQSANAILATTCTKPPLTVLKMRQQGLPAGRQMGLSCKSGERDDPSLPF